MTTNRTLMISRYTVLAVILLLTSVSCKFFGSRDTRKTYLDALWLNGIVKSIEISRATYYQKFGKWHQSDSYYSKRIEFDVRGNIISVVDDFSSQSYIYDKNDHEVVSLIDGIRTETDYSEKGQIQKEKIFVDGETNHSITYMYNSNGDVVEKKTQYADDSLHSRTSYSYNPEDRRVEENHYDSENALEWRIRYNYDSNGLLLEKQLLNPDGSISSKVTYDHNPKDKTLVETEYLPDGSITEDYYSGTKKNVLTESWQYDKEGMPESKRVCIHDHNGNILEEFEYDSEGDLVYHCAYKYDKNRNLIERTEYAEDMSISEKLIYTYNFDSQRNVTREIIDEETTRYGKNQKVPKEIISREYTYY